MKGCAKLGQGRTAERDRSSLAPGLSEGDGKVRARPPRRLPRLTLRSNFAWTVAGNVTYAACQWGMLVVLAKVGEPAMVGEFTLALAITAPVLMLTNMNLRGVQSTDARREYRFGDYLGLRLLTTALALLVIAGVALAAGYRPQTVAVILAMGLAKALESVSDVFYGLFQRHERLDRIAVSMMLRGSLSLVLLGGLVYLTGSVLWGTLGLAASWSLVLAAYDLRSGAGVMSDGEGAAGRGDRRPAFFPGLWPRWRPGTLARLTRLAWPLGLVMFLISLNANLPRYFIEHYRGLHDLGVFSALWYLTMAGGTIELAMGHAAHPRLGRYYGGGDRRAFGSLLLKLLAASALLGAAGVGATLLLGREILSVAYGTNYAGHAGLLAWIFVGAAVGYMASMLNFAMIAARRFFVQVPLFIAVNAVTLAACMALVPDYGLYGAAFALALGAAFQLVGAGGVVAWILYRGARP